MMTRNNGQNLALTLAALTAYAVAAYTFALDDGAAAPRLPVLAALSAVAVTWASWRLLAAYGRRLVIVRGALAGGLAGVLAHPVFAVLVVASDDLAGCAGAVCTLDRLASLAWWLHTGALAVPMAVIGLALAGPVTVLVGLLGGILAPLVAGRPAAPAAPFGRADEPG